MDEHTEIERRFLVDARREKPWRNGSDRFAIEQHYNVGALLHVHEQALYLNEVHVANLTVGELELFMAVDSWTTRLRKRNEDYVMTYKSRIADDTAYELEWDVSPDVAGKILESGPFPFVEKIRYLVQGSDGLVWEVDEFEGALAGLVLAEVELPSSQTEVVLPSWVGQEITGLRSWSNRALAETLSNQNRS